MCDDSALIAAARWKLAIVSVTSDDKDDRSSEGYLQLQESSSIAVPRIASGGARFTIGPFKQWLFNVRQHHFGPFLTGSELYRIERK